MVQLPPVHELYMKSILWPHTHTHKASSVCCFYCQYQVLRGRLGGHRDVIHTCLHMHACWSFAFIVAQQLFSLLADMHAVHTEGSPDPSWVINTCVFFKLAVRCTEVKACEVGTETVFSTVHPCPQSAAAGSPACFRMSLFLRKLPSFMSRLLSVLTCQLG